MCFLCQRSPCVVSGAGGSGGSEGAADGRRDGAPDGAPDGATTTTATGTTTSFVLSTEPATIPGQSEWGALKSGYVWTGSAVTFGFATGAADYYGYPDPGYMVPYSGYNEPSQFIALSAAGKGIVRAAVSSWSGIVNLTITEAASGVHPDLNIGGSSIPDTAWAYYPGANDSSGDVWFGLDKSFFAKLVGTSGPYLGSYEYATALHEIGHALGLKHPHQGTLKLAAGYDGLDYSVMSYRSYLGGPTSYYTVEAWGYPQSLMMLDIAAIQDLYGADFTTQSGATVYRFDPLTGEMTVNGASAGMPGANRVFRTIWDGGGSDTIDLSAYSTDLDIDLNPGKGIDLDVGGTLQRAQLSSTVYAAHHIYMSLLYNGDTRSLIENATGGAGDDILRGNQAANLLKGGAGADTLTGGLGADTLTLGAGTDTVADTAAGLDGDRITDFSLTEDRIVVQGATLAASQVWYDAVAGLLKIDTNGDRLADAAVTVNLGLAAPQILLATVQGGTQLSFAPGVVSPGNPPAATVSLTAGADTYVNAATTDQAVDGLAGADRITTGSGNDILYGGLDADLLKAMAGDDVLYGGAGTDTLYGGDGKDQLFGGLDADKLYGEAGADTLWGDEGNDYLYGGADDDTLSGGDGADRLYGATGTDTLSGDAGADLLYGGDGDDLLSGGADNDKLYGEAGNDVLNSGAGLKDVMTGGPGADVFVLDAADFTAGVTTSEHITDYAIGADSIRFYGFSATALSDFAARDTTLGARLTLGPANYLYLANMTVAQISAVSATFTSGPAPASAPEDHPDAGSLVADDSLASGGTDGVLTDSLADTDAWVFA